jgi:hypothetical protein
MATERGKELGMKFILGLLIGFIIGYKLSERELATPNAPGRRFVDTVTRVGTTAVDRARTTIQARMGADGHADWS